MTTTVTIKANGPNYPVRITKTQVNDSGGVCIEDRLLAGGDSTEFYLPNGVHLSISEEYHPEGYPAK